NKKKTQTLCRVSFTKRSLRRLRHLHLRWSLFPHNRLCLRHLYRNSNLSPASSTIIHLHLFLTRQTRNRFRHSHIRLQLQVTLICLI
ncbi:BnaAnng39770D, partial [Brassica napus]